MRSGEQKSEDACLTASAGREVGSRETEVGRRKSEDGRPKTEDRSLRDCKS